MSGLQARRYASRKRYRTETLAWLAATPVRQSRLILDNLDKAAGRWQNTGIWALKDSISLFGVGDVASALVDFRVSTRTLTRAGSPTHTFAANVGFTGSGAASGSQTDYVEVPFTPSTAGGNWTQNGAHMNAHSRTSGAASGFDLGANGTHDAYLRFMSANQTDWRMNNNGNLTAQANTDGSGLIGSARIAADDARLFRNGEQYGSTITTASSGLPDQNFRYLQVQSLAGTVRTLTYGSFGGGLTAAQMRADYEITRDLLAALDLF